MSSQRSIGVVIVDESATCRHAIGAGLGEAADIEVLSIAPNAKTGLSKVERYRPTVAVVSARLPDMSLEELCDRCLEACPELAIIVTFPDDASVPSTLMRAISEGDFEVVVKPRSLCGDEQHEALRRRLVPKIRTLSTAAYSRKAMGISGGGPISRRRSTPPPPAPARRAVARKDGVEVVVVGASTGGPDAIKRLLGALPADMPVPVVVVVHMPGLFTASLADALDSKSVLTVKEAKSRDVLRPGWAYIAPGGRHLVVERSATGDLVLRTIDDIPVNGCRPSVDVLFKAAADAAGAGALAAILTGMGSDGTEGLAALKAAGAQVLAQDEESSVVWGMPGSAVRAGLVDEVLSVDDLARCIVEKVTG